MIGHSKPRLRFAAILWVLLFLFILRVLGQLLVSIGWGTFLPPMDEWYSGVVPYPRLLVSQIIIIILFSKVCLDLTKGRGFFSIPNQKLGSGLLFFGTVYLLVMIIRYALRMSLYPTERWVGGCIPIFFHWILAAFILLVGSYHRFQKDLEK